MEKVMRITTLVDLSVFPGPFCFRRLRQCLPDGSVEDGDAENIPLRSDPAPQSGVAVHTTFFRGRDENQGQGHNEGDPVA